MDKESSSEILRFLDGGQVKQFRYVVTVLTGFSAAILTSVIYKHLFGQFTIKLSLELMISNCLDPRGLYAMLFFKVIYFGFFPFVGISAIVFFRGRVHSLQKMSKRQRQNFVTGYEMSETKEAIEQIPKSEAEKLIARINIRILDELNSFVISLSY
jgi:hypothetical protein